MENKQKAPKRSALIDLIVVMLFFIGIGLITAALWALHAAAGMGFLGCATLYLAGCISHASGQSGKDGKR